MDNESIKHRHLNKPRHTTSIETRPYPTPSKWQQIVVGASSAAAVVSKESMKCLKYCIYWLQYAIKHIEHQMTLIKNYLVSVATQRMTTETSIANVKKDIISTLRKVVNVITKYAGDSLPFHARQSVRGFILNLPERWALVCDSRSSTTSPAASPLLLPVEDDGKEEEAIRLLTFGQESIEMLNSVHHIFSDTVNRAEVWIERLKKLPGIQQSETKDVRLPSIRNLNLDSQG